MLDTARIAVSQFFEMSESDERAMAARLSSAGFRDITLGDVLVLAALQMRNHAEKGTRKRPKTGGGVSREMTDKLLSRGYLEDRGGPDDPDRTGIVLTSQGLLAVDVVMDGVLVDRWGAFPFRPGDIVISAPGKCGTTWMQMICALLVFQTPDLPAPLNELSPWLDDPVGIRHEVFERYAAQRNRRFIKTHSSLADVPAVPQVTYIVVARHPLDAAVSSYHQRKRLEHASGSADRSIRGSAREWLLDWIAEESASPARPSDLDAMLRHFADAWARREEPNVVLTHYEDLSADLEGQMRILAERLGITVAEVLWPGLVKAATFEQMRAAADRIEPFAGVLEDSASFFRRGVSGSGAELLTTAELADYHTRVARNLEPDVLTWLHR
ncbi:sulfotransferase domain-containing protein [Streptomyces sp. NPDC006335]|uniref:sulfotransferase domain-containing protein n=1 Tax=Streptomyces sp. NPDC006335 TaxID=3156895 RepID=UPI0033B7B8E9